MAKPTPRQVAVRRRIEGLIGLAAPALDLLLWAGDHLSRRVGGEDTGWVPPRPTGESASKVRG
ncbi:MAG: hypothetical protein ACR2K9_00515 [Solirubrobacteraceae bacterium]